MFVRTPEGWVTATWTHLPLVTAPFADFTWRHALTLAPAGATEAEIARVLDDLLTRAQTGAQVIPFGVFDADAEAVRWL